MKTLFVALLTLALGLTAVAKETPEIPVFAISRIQAEAGADTREMKIADREEVWHVEQKAVMTERDVAEVTQSIQEEVPVLQLKLTKEGTQKLAQLTEQWKGKRLAMVMSGKLISALEVRHPVAGDLSVTGFSEEQAQHLIKAIQSRKQ